MVKPVRDAYGAGVDVLRESDGSLSLQVSEAGATDRLGAFGEVLTAQVSPKAAWRFDYGTAPNTRLYTATTANGGAATITESRLLLSTGVNVAGSARLQTQRRLRYMPGMGGLVRFTAVFGIPKALSRQMIGQGDTADGFFFGYNGVSFGVFLRRASATTFVDRSDWNGSPVDFNPALGNVFQIRYQWLGFGFIRYYVLHPTDPALGFVLVHTIYYPNTQTVTSILNPTLPLMAEAVNLGNNTNVTLMTPSALGALEGETSAPFNPLNIGNSFDASASFADANNNHFMTIRNKATFGGVANRIPVTVNSLNLARAGGAAPFSTIRIYRNATFAAGLTFADVDTANSPVEVSTTTTTITGGTAERAYVLTDAVTFQAVEYREKEVVLQPGEALTIAVQNSSAAPTGHVNTANWIEEQ